VGGCFLMQVEGFCIGGIEIILDLSLSLSLTLSPLSASFS